MRDVIFISHATPEDNDFAIWLSARLTSAGYEVWIDKSALLGGEKFWEEIDQTIRNKAIKFLLVYSENICVEKKPGLLKDGISKEYSLAESVAKQFHLSDFLMLLNIDGSKHHLFIGADRLNQFSFSENWAHGLTQLIKKLQKDNVTTKEQDSTKLSAWYENKYVLANGIIDKKELYYDNWWPIRRLPNSLFIHRFEKESDAKLLLRRDNPYPVAKISNAISTFDPEFSYQIQDEDTQYLIPVKDKYEIKISELLADYRSSQFPTRQDAENHLKNLLERVFHVLLVKKRQLSFYRMANKRLAYFFTPKVLPHAVTFFYSHRKKHQKKTKNLIGKYLSNMWHFALSGRAILSPIVGFSLKSHLTFTERGFNVWGDVAKIHSHRRSKGKAFFNEEWRDMLFAYLQALRNENGEISIDLHRDFTLNMGRWTNKYLSAFGYQEPRDRSRQYILEEYFDDAEQEEP